MRFVAGLIAAALLVSAPSAFAQDKTRPPSQAQIDYTGFRNLTGEVEAYRAGRLISLADFQRMNAVYVSYFPKGRLPARTTVGVAELLDGCLIEIDCIARLR